MTDNQRATIVRFATETPRVPTCRSTRQLTLFVFTFVATLFLSAVSPARAIEIPTTDHLADWARRTANSVASHLPSPGICERCGRPTLPGQNDCLKCLSHSVPRQTKEWFGRRADDVQDAIKKLRSLELPPEWRQRVNGFIEELERPLESEVHKRREESRRFYESLGRMPVPGTNRTLNDSAREFIRKHLPQFEGTDYAADPAKALSYLLALDTRGFVRNVRVWRGPGGAPMTMLEAFNAFSRTDPKKAEEMVEIMDNLTTVLGPGELKDKVPALLNSGRRTFRLLRSK